MTSLLELRAQIDDIDQSIIQNLFQGGAEEDYLDEVVELTDEDKQKLRSTRLYFSEKICELLQKRVHISANIGHIKRAEGIMNMVDEERRKIMIESRVKWAPKISRNPYVPCIKSFTIYRGGYSMSEKICKNNFFY